jgi:hypothetical protein
MMTNFFYDLPEDLQYQIYKFSHNIKYNDVLIDIYCRKPWWVRFDNRYKMLFKLYNSDMSKKELDYYFTSRDILFSLLLREKYSSV